MTRERRKYPRLALPIRVRIRLLYSRKAAASTASVCLTRNFAQEGLFISTPRVRPIGTRLGLSIYLDREKEPILACGKVIWIAHRKTQPAYYPGMGVRVAEMSPADHRRLQRFFSEKMQNYRDALELHEMYDTLKAMAARLVDIENRHLVASHFRRTIDHAIQEIDEVAHLIDRGVWKVRRL